MVMKVSIEVRWATLFRLIRLGFFALVATTLILLLADLFSLKWMF